MKKNVPGQTLHFAGILKASGDDAPDLSPTGTDTIVVDVNKDAAGFVTGLGTIKYLTGGTFEYAPTQAETNADHVTFRARESTIITQLANMYPINPDDYKADVSGLSTFDHTSDQVTTDAASRTASQADVSGLLAKDTAYRWTNSGGGAGYDDVTVTDAP